MTRPKDLPTPLKTYATGTYGAGPSWGGTPQRSAPGANFMTPGVTLPAEVENYLHGSAFDAVQASINCFGQMMAMNLGQQASVTSAGSIAWSDVEQAWYASFAAASGFLVRSQDNGRTFPNLSLAVSKQTQDLGFDTAGNCVTVASDGTIQDAPFVAFGTSLVFTNRGVKCAYTAGAPSQVLYEPSNALWCVIGDSSTAVSMFTSPDRVTWTARALPATWNLTGGVGGMGVGNGLLVAVAPATGTTFRTIRSSNGGVTWTNDQVITTPSGTITTLTTRPMPVWSATDALWYVALNTGISPRKTFVYSSPDAITWTLAASLIANDCCFVSVQTIGSIVIGVNDDGRIFCSMNQGANWFRCGWMGGAPANSFGGGAGIGGVSVRAGGGGFAVVAPTIIAASLRMGLPTLAA